MKRINILTLALTLVLGCWAGSASARPLEASSALLLPYYEAKDNLATIIGVQHVGAVPTEGQVAGDVSIINVAVYNGEDGVVEDLGFICLARDEFGFVVLQSPKPTAQDPDWGKVFSVAEDDIPETGFVTLAYAGVRTSCGSGGAAGAAPTAGKDVMVAWAILQDNGNGFFATEIPMLEVGWLASVSDKKLAKGLEPYCYRNTDRSKAMDRRTTVLNSDKTACLSPSTHTFVKSGPYCYSNDDDNRAVAGLDPTDATTYQLNDKGDGCKEEFTHTFVKANTTLPEIPAVGPGAAISCTNSTDCPGLVFNSDSPPSIGARFDVASANKTASHIYMWLGSAPSDSRETSGLSVVCEDGTKPTLTSSQLNSIDINGFVTEIDPSGLGCSGRGVLELVLPRRTSANEFCYDSTDDNRTAVDGALDADNNRCKKYTFTSDINNTDASTADKTPGCYDSGISYAFTNDINNDGTSGDPGCYDKNAFPTPRETTTAVEKQSQGGVVNGCYSRSITAVGDAGIGSPVTKCKSYNYVADVTDDNPNGYIFSHISQDGAHYRMNFPGYKK